MIDNLKYILPLLTFESDDDFYYLQVLQRKKENPQLGSNSRVIKNYYITNPKMLEDIYPEVVVMCNQFQARASIRLNKRSFKDVAWKTMINLSNTMRNQEFKFVKNCYDRACGQGHNDKDKTWIIDFDHDTPFTKDEVVHYIHSIEPEGRKVVSIIPSKSGFHIITTPFRLDYFKNQFPGLDVHKDNPTNLYIP